MEEAFLQTAFKIVYLGKLTSYKIAKGNWWNITNYSCEERARDHCFLAQAHAFTIGTENVRKPRKVTRRKIQLPSSLNKYGD